jgi:hypothetical protein
MNHLNLIEACTVHPSGAQGFKKSFLRGKPGGIMLKFVGFRFAVSYLARRKNHFPEATVFPDAACHALNVYHINTYTKRHVYSLCFED